MYAKNILFLTNSCPEKGGNYNLSVLTKTQTSKKGTPDEFSIDIIKDLIRSITGEPNTVLPEEFGNVITGNEGIYISPKINLKQIPFILEKLIIEFGNDKYKERFDWIDNIKTEKDPLVIDALKLKLVSDLRDKNSEKIHLAPPYIVEWESFGGISFTQKGEIFNEFNIENLYSLKKESIEELDWEKLSRMKIYLKDKNSDERFGYYLWRFINYQTEYAGFNYIFTMSNWYRVDKSYFEELYNYCKEIKESSSIFIDCKEDENEGEYNERLSNSSTDFVKLDRNLIRSEISRSQIEACDVFSRSKELIHIKFRESSSTLSHLFAQGRVSSNSLRKDKTFRINFRSKLKTLGFPSSLIPLEDKDFNPSNFTITYAIIEKKDRSFVDALPFFSLINFRLTAAELMHMGFNVNVKKIKII